MTTNVLYFKRTLAQHCLILRIPFSIFCNVLIIKFLFPLTNLNFSILRCFLKIHFNLLVIIIRLACKKLCEILYPCNFHEKSHKKFYIWEIFSKILRVKIWLNFPSFILIFLVLESKNTLKVRIVSFCWNFKSFFYAFRSSRL